MPAAPRTAITITAKIIFFILRRLLFLLDHAADITHGPPQVDAGYVVAEQRIDTVIPRPLQPRLGIGNFKVGGKTRLVTAAGLRELAVGESQPFLGDLELFFRRMQAIERRADVEFNLFVQIVGAQALLAELGCAFGAPRVPPAAIEDRYAQSHAIVPGGQQGDNVAVGSSGAI